MIIPATAYPNQFSLLAGPQLPVLQHSLLGAVSSPFLGHLHFWGSHLFWLQQLQHSSPFFRPEAPKPPTYLGARYSGPRLESLPSASPENMAGYRFSPVGLSCLLKAEFELRIPSSSLFLAWSWFWFMDKCFFSKYYSV